MTKLRIEALPDEVQETLLFLEEAEAAGRLRLRAVSRPYANTRSPRDERVRVYTEIELCGGRKRCE